METSDIKKNDSKTVNAWCMYDWANSVYSLTITTAVFPPYFLSMTKTEMADGTTSNLTSFFGLAIENSVLYSYTLSFAFLISALLGPLLGGIADYSGKKKSFMKFFSTLGAISCASLFFFNSSNIEFGVIAFAMAGIGYAGSLVYYNSYLPDIVTEDQLDKVSAKGFSLGYIGSVILLIFNLVMILQPTLFGIDPEDGALPAKISFLTVGIWWFVFAAYTFKHLPNPPKKTTTDSMLTKGFKELLKVQKQMKSLPYIKTFLIAFFVYSMGVQTVMYLATIFGEKVVGMGMGELIGIVLILQLIAIAGAYLFSTISGKIGNVKTLSISLTVWIGVCVAAYSIGPGDKTSFYLLAVFVGLVMGGVQSLSRSTYSKFVPSDSEDKASYFSFYEFVEKLGIVLGTFVYGLIEQITGSMNLSALVLGVFFVIGMVILSKIPSKTNYNTTLNK